jgi:hypothetical protein
VTVAYSKALDWKYDAGNGQNHTNLVEDISFLWLISNSGPGDIVCEQQCRFISRPVCVTVFRQPRSGERSVWIARSQNCLHMRKPFDSVAGRNCITVGVLPPHRLGEKHPMGEGVWVQRCRRNRVPVVKCTSTCG